MDLIFTILKNAVLLFVGFVAFLFVIALLFGKRKVKRWEFEAEFHDAAGREFGEFDIEMSKIEKEEPDYSFKATLSMRHASLVSGAEVRVLLEDTLVLEGQVEKPGRIRLGNAHIVNRLTRASEGQLAKVLVSNVEVATAELVPD